jgi:uncharacterized phage-associated protein
MPNFASLAMDRNLQEKLEAFEYMVFRLAEWYKENNGLASDYEFSGDNDFSKLKVIKLHFFTTAINAERNTLLRIFNHFHAMPYGHVESQVYENINSLQRYTINNDSLTIKPEYYNNLSDSFTLISLSIKEEIDLSVYSLRQNNSAFVNYTAFQLVELSHSWFSWKSMFNFARANDRYSEFIPSEIIQEENKFFSIDALSI